MANQISSVGFSDYSAEQQDIERRRAYAQALQQQGQTPMGPTEMAGGWAVRKSPLEGLAKMLQAYGGRKGQDEATERQKALGERVKADRGSDMTLLASMLRGAPATSETIVDEQAAGGMGAPATINAPARPGGFDPAMATQLRSPEGQAIAMQQFVEQMKPKELKAYKPGDVLYQGGAQVGAIPAAPKFHAVGGNLVPEPAIGAAPGTQVSPVYTAPQKPDELTAALAAAGIDPKSPEAQALFKARATKIATHQPPQKVSVETKVNSFLPASEEAQRDFMKSTRTTYDQLKQAPVLLDSLEKAKALIPAAKGFMGPGGETLLEATKFLNNRLGMTISTEGVKSAEELRTRIFFNIMDNLKKMDAQPSQMQQQIMMESLGKLGTDPNALPNVLNAFGDVIRGKVDLHNKEVEGAVSRGVKFPYDPRIGQKSPGAVPEFATEADAIKAGVKGKVKIGGRNATIN